MNNFHISLKVSISGEQLKIRKYLTVNNYPLGQFLRIPQKVSPQEEEMPPQTGGRPQTGILSQPASENRPKGIWVLSFVKESRGRMLCWKRETLPCEIMYLTLEEVR